MWPHLCLSSLTQVILANLGCQLDRIWDQQKNASGLFILKDLLLKGEDPAPELVASSGHSPDTKREKRVSFPPASPASSVCCWHRQNPASSGLQHGPNICDFQSILQTFLSTLRALGNWTHGVTTRLSVSRALRLYCGSTHPE